MRNNIEITEVSNPSGISVDVTINNHKIETGDNPMYSYDFWQKLEGHVQRALFRIKSKNPKMGFDFNLQSMMVTDEMRVEKLKSQLKKQVEGVDVELAFQALDHEINKIKGTGPDDNHPNPYFKVQLDSDILKAVFCHALKYYNESINQVAK